jgi:tight adherence protein B
MLTIILAAGLGILATVVLVSLTTDSGSAKRVKQRFANLDRSFESADDEEKLADIRKEGKKLTAIPWLNHWLTKLNLASASTLYLYQAGMSVSLGTLLVSSVAGFGVLAVILYLRFGAAVPALLMSAGFLPVPFLRVRLKRKKRLFKLEQQLPEAIGMMVSALRVGHSLIASLGAVTQESPEPIATEMRKCFEEQNYGIDLRTALANLTMRAPVQDFRIFAAAVLIQKESGGNLAEVLEKVAQTTRERFRLKKQVRVHTAQGRTTGWVLSILPALLGFGMYLINPDVMSVLWKRPVGQNLLCTAIVMDIVGALIIRNIVEIHV